MPRVRWRQTLAVEDMAQMATAVGALDLDSMAVGGWQTVHRAADLLVECWPAAMGIEFVVGTV